MRKVVISFETEDTDEELAPSINAAWYVLIRHTESVSVSPESLTEVANEDWFAQVPWQ